MLLCLTCCPLKDMKRLISDSYQTCPELNGQTGSAGGDISREFKLHVSGNGKRQVRTFLAKFSLYGFVSYFLFCVERIIICISVLKQQVHLLFIVWYRKMFLCLAFAIWRITRSLTSLDKDWHLRQTGNRKRQTSIRICIQFAFPKVSIGF
jgi:hypothetical protein